MTSPRPIPGLVSTPKLIVCLLIGISLGLVGYQFVSLFPAPVPQQPLQPEMSGNWADDYDTPFDPQRALPIGKTAQLSTLQITLTSAHSVTAVANRQAAVPNREYWLVDVIFENPSATQDIMIDRNGLWITDAPYDSLSYYALDNEGIVALSRPLYPGETRRVTLLHEVIQSAQNLYWAYYDHKTMQPFALFKVK
jgi:hypothetical protein